MSKSAFTEKELEEFRQLLLEKKARILREIQTQTEEAMHEAEEPAGGPGDMVDMATGLLEQELNLSLTESEKHSLREIDEALDRISKNEYGICIDTGEVIAKARLKAVPEAKRTVQAQEKFDKIQNEKKRRAGAQYKPPI